MKPQSTRESVGAVIRIELLLRETFEESILTEIEIDSVYYENFNLVLTKALRSIIFLQKFGKKSFRKSILCVV